ncbi:MAG: copper homeostasis protein CutC [Saprospiraceae bacterium]|nr:copper homeostasis protein CutC [Saprospiraceae bacterium]
MLKIDKYDLIIESCVETLEEAIRASQHGASQLEICSHLDVDGLTPDTSLLRDILKAVEIPCKVMIRLRSGDFYYTREEMKTMMDSIAQIKTYPIAGIVFGANTKDTKGQIILDLSAIRQVCEASYPLPVTIHKAIDLCSNISDEVIDLKDISNVGFVLSSGGEISAHLGADMLINMQQKAGNHIQIIAAGKILPENISSLVHKTRLRYFHGRNII